MALLQLTDCFDSLFSNPISSAMGSNVFLFCNLEYFHTVIVNLSSFFEGAIRRSAEVSAPGADRPLGDGGGASVAAPKSSFLEVEVLAIYW